MTYPQRNTSDSLMAIEQVSGRIKNKTTCQTTLTQSLSTVKKLTQLRV